MERASASSRYIYIYIYIGDGDRGENGERKFRKTREQIGKGPVGAALPETLPNWEDTVPLAPGPHDTICFERRGKGVGTICTLSTVNYP